MKILLLFPNNYTLKDIFIQGFNELGHEAVSIDYAKFFSSSELKMQSYLFKLPYNIRRSYEEKIFRKINDTYLSLVINQKPDIVLVYNDQRLLSETARKIKKHSKLFFFLGDNPLFVQKRPYNLATIMEGDHIFSPDSHWIEQFNIMGINNISFLIPGYNTKLNYKRKISEEESNKFGSDIVFIGRQYYDTWGYKRALFCSKFCGMNFKVYGDKEWFKWLDSFPELNKHFYLNKTYLSFETVNTILNASKIYPVDANSGLINGLHIRIFECIGSGILPVVEYRKDIDAVFNGVEIPVIKDYSKAREIVENYIDADQKRNSIVNNLFRHINSNYTPLNTANKLIKTL